MKTRVNIYDVIMHHSGYRIDEIKKYSWNEDDLGWYFEYWQKKGWIYDLENHTCYKDFDGLLVKKGDEFFIPLECEVQWVVFDTDLGMWFANLIEQ